MRSGHPHRARALRRRLHSGDRRALSDPARLLGTDAPEGPTQCAFGSPDHTFEISVVVSTAAARRRANGGVAGHPAHIRPLEVPPSLAKTSYVVARDAAARPGFLAVDLTAWPERGTGLRQISGLSAEPDLTNIKAAEAFVADLVEALL